LQSCTIEEILIEKWRREYNQVSPQFAWLLPFAPAVKVPAELALQR